MNRSIMLIVVMLVALAPVRADDIAQTLNRLFRTDSVPERQALISEIVKTHPAPDTLIAVIKRMTFAAPESTGFIRGDNRCRDGVSRPFFWYVPKIYDPAKKTPLLVCLHGGVMQPAVSEKPDDMFYPIFKDLADRAGYILLLPAGEAKAAWWDSVGVANVLAQVRATKRKFNIDDDRVYMTGFSDGGSGSFFFAMCCPTDFAAFMPLNGHPGVGSIDGGIQMYFVNLANRPLSVVNTDRDELYPDSAMRPMMALAREAGADLLYRVYAGIGHEFAYAPKEIPRMAEFIAGHPRNNVPVSITWETAYPELGRCMWLAIETIAVDSIGSGPGAAWYRDYDMELVNDRVMFGFVPDDKYQGRGVRIGKVVGDSTFCGLAGVKDGDIIVRLGKKSIGGMKDVAAYKAKKKCGDGAEMTVLREGKETTFSGRFPGPVRYPLFRRGLPSNRIEASYLDNTFSVRASNTGVFSIYLDPRMVDLDRPVRVLVDGKEVFDKKVAADPTFILDNFLDHRDRQLLYVNKITIRL